MPPDLSGHVTATPSYGGLFHGRSRKPERFFQSGRRGRGLGIWCRYPRWFRIWRNTRVASPLSGKRPAAGGHAQRCAKRCGCHSQVARAAWEWHPLPSLRDGWGQRDGSFGCGRRRRLSQDDLDHGTTSITGPRWRDDLDGGRTSITGGLRWRRRYACPAGRSGSGRTAGLLGREPYPRS